MTKRLLTDTELRAAAAARPGYATYPEYRPGQPERLGRLPAPTLPPTWVLKTMLPAWTDDDTEVLKAAFRAAARRAPLVLPPPATVALDARPPAPAAAPVAATVGELPETRVFDFQPRRIARPWWRRRWHWGVIAAGARTRHGYAWTEAGARHRTARAVRRAERHG